jgi:Mg2+/Co2+ transporter CorB
MIPRQDIVGIDLEHDWAQTMRAIRQSEFHRLPVFRGDIDNIVGVVQVRRLLPDIAGGTLTEERLLACMRDPYFVPEGTPLNKQLLRFQQQQRRAAFVVDEYGDVQGLITTEDILREIVGEFDQNAKPSEIGIIREGDDSFIVDAGVNVRQLNRLMNWSLPTDGPKTLNGLIVEQLECIPEAGTDLTVANYPIEILDTSEHAIKKVRVSLPGLREYAQQGVA